MKNENWEKEFDDLKIIFTSDIDRSICKQFIESLLSSHDAELRRKVEEVYTVLQKIKEIESKTADEYAKQNKLYSPEIRQWAIVGQKLLDAVLALLTKENV